MTALCAIMTLGVLATASRCQGTFVGKTLSNSWLFARERVASTAKQTISSAVLFAHPCLQSTCNRGLLSGRLRGRGCAAIRARPCSPEMIASSQLFGSRPGSGEEGSIVIANEQNVLPDLDIDKLERTVKAIRQILRYETFDVALILTGDEEIREMNRDCLGIDRSTDILSFPLFDKIEVPGKLPEPEFDIPDYYCLGEMMMSVPYVIRRCEEDANDEEIGLEDKERGISGAMATEFDPEKRLHMLLVHGMLHLVGYDHMEDEDYVLMVSREEEILQFLGIT